MAARDDLVCFWIFPQGIYVEILQDSYRGLAESLLGEIEPTTQIFQIVILNIFGIDVMENGRETTKFLLNPP